MNEDYSLRPLRSEEAADVLFAFASDSEILRQGTVRDLDEADAYVARLMEPSDRHQPSAITDDDVLVRLVCVDGDAKNRNG